MKKNIIKVNLGCGPSGVQGWINYDWGLLPLLSKFPWLRTIIIKFGYLPKEYNTKWPKIYLVDIRKGLPLDDYSVDYIYSSHVFEHFEKWILLEILKECKRVLKKGGVMRIVIPDLKKMIRDYKGADNFCREFYGFKKDVKNPFKLFIRGHEWMYDNESLKDILKQISFTNIYQRKAQEGLTPDINLLDLKDHQKLSLYLEVIKT
jgi:predicted SAM-dependent methyltransferase